MQRSLVIRARDGDSDAFEALAAEAFGQLYRTAWLILRSSDQAADAVQEALTSAWVHIRAVRDPDRFEAWLHRLLVHACYRELRQVRRRVVAVAHLPTLEVRAHGRDGIGSLRRPRAGLGRRSPAQAASGIARASRQSLGLGATA
jgi:RNA polymerase sigma factor (sigma-70 family)